MKTFMCSLFKKLVPGFIITLFLLAIPNLYISATTPTDLSTASDTHNEYTGIVVDRKTGTPLEYANFLVIGTNISIVSNKEGEFLIKIPKEISDAKVKVSYLGYKDMIVPTSTMKAKYARIYMEALVVKLPEFEVVAKNPYELIRNVMDRKSDNYTDTKTLMKAFYRETINNKRDYISLAEAVINVVKNPYYSMSPDYLKLNQVRKKTDYTMSDSITLKLIGGPMTCLTHIAAKKDNFIAIQSFASLGIQI